MKFINGLNNFDGERDTAITFGKFDGIHIGHQKLIAKVNAYAVWNHVDGVVCTFYKEQHKNSLLTPEEKKEYLFGKVDYYVNCPFTEDFKNMSAEDFIEKVICGIFHAKYVVVGTDFRFGKDRVGDVAMLDQYADTYGYKLEVVEKEEVAGRIVSSTYIREVLRAGNVAMVNYMLGYNYHISGTVRHGKALGRTLGFPTMNIEWPKLKVVPPRGVYLGRVMLAGDWYPAICNVGVKPTVSEENIDAVECFLLNYKGDAYDKTIRVEFLEYRRPEIRFDSIDELKSQVDKDIAFARSYFGLYKM